MKMRIRARKMVLEDFMTGRVLIVKCNLGKDANMSVANTITPKPVLSTRRK